MHVAPYPHILVKHVFKNIGSTKTDAITFHLQTLRGSITANTKKTYS